MSELAKMKEKLGEWAEKQLAAKTYEKVQYANLKSGWDMVRWREAWLQAENQDISTAELACLVFYQSKPIGDWTDKEITEQMSYTFETPEEVIEDLDDFYELTTT